MHTNSMFEGGFASASGRSPIISRTTARFSASRCRVSFSISSRERPSSGGTQSSSSRLGSSCTYHLCQQMQRPQEKKVKPCLRQGRIRNTSVVNLMHISYILLQAINAISFSLMVLHVCNNMETCNRLANNHVKGPISKSLLPCTKLLSPPCAMCQLHSSSTDAGPQHHRGEDRLG